MLTNPAITASYCKKKKKKKNGRSLESDVITQKGAQSQQSTYDGMRVFLYIVASICSSSGRFVVFMSITRRIQIRRYNFPLFDLKQHCVLQKKKKKKTGKNEVRHVNGTEFLISLSVSIPWFFSISKSSVNQNGS